MTQSVISAIRDPLQLSARLNGARLAFHSGVAGLNLNAMRFDPDPTKPAFDKHVAAALKSGRFKMPEIDTKPFCCQLAGELLINQRIMAR
ncbi:MAG: hypothetical protein CTY28_09070 [Hyphomicrobium sp.]|nr:MAG: hypothetical protein CTY28_09070 [Hyphomicrobium sp.]